MLNEVRVKTVFKLRRDSSQNWTEKNPKLAQGEPGFETDSNKMKVGDGETLWNDLEYLKGVTAIPMPDEKSITVNGSLFSLLGFQEANENYSIRKNSDGVLEWFAPATYKEVETLKDIVNSMKESSINSISINSTPLQINNHNIDIPIATNSLLGVIKGSNNRNSCSIKENGELEINSVGVSKLVNEEGVSLVLTSGNASNK